MSTTPTTPLYPSTPAGHSFQTIVYQQPTVVEQQFQIPQFQQLQQPQFSNNPLVYFVNDVPHYCYPQQSDILYPVYMPSDMWQPYEPPMQFSVPNNQRFLGEIAETVMDAAGDALKQELNKAEQQVVDKVRTCCFGLFRLY